MEMVAEVDTALLQRARLLGVRIGKTPQVNLSKLTKREGVELWVKEEWKQLSGSVKCRAAYRIILDAVAKGELVEDRILLDATSGNTGIAYAAIGKLLNIPVTLCLPENASIERKNILKELGATILFTSKFEGTDGAQQVARELADKHPGKYFYANQYSNENNWKAHYETTAPEIFAELPQITHFVCGLGTTGTFMGTGRRLREMNPSIKMISLQPDSALHGLEGWKHMETARVPSIYDPGLADHNLQVSTEEAYDTLRNVFRLEGTLLSPSSAANLAGALKLIEGLEEGIVVTVLPDNADKYGEVIKKIL